MSVLARHYQFDRVMRRVLDAKDDAILRQLVPELYAHWGDPPSQSAEAFIQSCITHASNCAGHVLQCGTSLATLFLGVVCARNEESQTHLWCLEHDSHWANLIRSWLSEYGIVNTHVVVARPQLYDGYIWYAIDTKQLPKNFGLALCEGGNATPRGVIGLVEKMGDKLSSESVILAKNVLRTKDHEYLSQWAMRQGLRCVLVDKREGFYKVARGGSESPANSQLPR